MPVDLSPSFIKAFEGEVHNAYQRQGSKLRDTVRARRGVMGSSVTFRKVGRRRRRPPRPGTARSR